MAGAGTKLFVAGDVLTASQVNTYLMDQTIARYDSTTDRDNAYGGAGEPTLAEGMFCYLNDSNILQVYNGSSWVSLIDADDPSTSPGGSDHQVQFNDGGSFGGDANFTYDGSAIGAKATLTVGEDDAGHDIVFWGDTAGSYWFWDTSLNQMEVSQQYTSATITNFTQSLDNATIHIVGDYEAGHYQGAILWSTDDDSATKPKAGIFCHYDSGGATMYFGTSASYGTGINDSALMSLDDDGKVQIHAQANALSIVDTATNQSGYIGFYDSNPTRLGYVGYPANDDLYVKNEDGDGDIYIKCDNGRIYLQAQTYIFWSIAGAYELRLDSASFRAYSDDDLTLGSTSSGWKRMFTSQGTAAAPAWSFKADSDTGIYSTSNVLRFATSGYQRGLFSSSGFYSIKSVAVGTYALWASSGYLVAYSSSQRYKTNIEDLPKSEWEKVYQLNAKKFDWDESVEEVEIDGKRGKHDHGFIAEEVEGILPKVVNYDMIDHEDESKGYRCESVNYGEITTYLVEVVKDLNNRIKVLEG